MTFPTRPLLAVLAALALTLALAACGGDDDDSGGGSGSTSSESASEPKPFAIEVTGAAKNAELKAPKTAEAGLLEVTLNNGVDKGAHSAQLVKVDGDVPTAEVMKAGDAWGDKGKKLPDYLTFA